MLIALRILSILSILSGILYLIIPWDLPDKWTLEKQIKFDGFMFLWTGVLAWLICETSAQNRARCEYAMHELRREVRMEMELKAKIQPQEKAEAKEEKQPEPVHMVINV
jgi:hypothetical protein